MANVVFAGVCQLLELWGCCWPLQLSMHYDVLLLKSMGILAEVMEMLARCEKLDLCQNVFVDGQWGAYRYCHNLAERNDFTCSHSLVQRLD